MPPYFFNKTLRNLIVGFQTLFNNVTIKRYDDEGNVVKEIPVPLKFGPMHKYYMPRNITLQELQRGVHMNIDNEPKIALDVSLINIRKKERLFFFVKSVKKGNHIVKTVDEPEPEPEEIKEEEA